MPCAPRSRSDIPHQSTMQAAPNTTKTVDMVLTSVQSKGISSRRPRQNRPLITIRQPLVRRAMHIPRLLRLRPKLLSFRRHGRLLLCLRLRQLLLLLLVWSPRGRRPIRRIGCYITSPSRPAGNVHALARSQSIFGCRFKWSRRSRVGRGPSWRNTHLARHHVHTSDM